MCTIFISEKRVFLRIEIRIFEVLLFISMGKCQHEAVGVTLNQSERYFGVNLNMFSQTTKSCVKSNFMR